MRATAQVFGIAVAPPAVCLVMELAVRSLRAMLNDAAAYAALTWRDKLRICVECCQVRTQPQLARRLSGSRTSTARQFVIEFELM